MIRIVEKRGCKKSASHGVAEISGENRDIFKFVPYLIEICKTGKSWITNNKKVERNQLATHNATIVETMQMVQ